MKQVLQQLFGAFSAAGLSPRPRQQTEDGRISALHALLQKQRFAELNQQFARLPAELQFPALQSLSCNGKAVENWLLLQPNLPALLAHACTLLALTRKLSSPLEQHTLLQEADDCLQRAHTLAPDDPLPFCVGIAVGCALGKDMDTLEERFAALRQRAPRHYWGQLQLVLAYTERRDDAGMLAFARKMHRRSPRGDGCNLMPVLAHLQIASRFESLADREAYCQRSDVHDDIVRCYLRSLASSHYVVNAATSHQRNHMAVALILGGALRHGLRELRRLDGYDPQVWRLLAANWRENRSPALIIDRLQRHRPARKASKPAALPTVLRSSLSQMTQTIPG
ncbi:hypothetical protein [Chitinilyticum piscinae]|uniref:Uncharacterized protein n=1 Tax=Chitinilyticum piscinae TaxID=2866724 RepID=A0A8J7FII2_9NEIS|nr:hypothetical protein [Chitinilyticum piscinae]MBE9608037.1 hypothetical protein [Chitinilyticum piscinae]